ncbi:MAG: hypothetical protein U5K55_01800 [Aliarcobacter sp.]|nr:hypothetical protein [Aliarcobacter sp.]
MKSIILLLICISLYSNEISVYGKFNLGDSFTGVFKSLCENKSITVISPAPGVGYMPKDEFCKDINKTKQIIGNAVLNGGFSPLRPVKNIKGFENVASKYLYISAKQIDISGLDFELILELGTVHQQEIAGSYLLTKDDVLNIGKYKVPFQLNSVELKTINDSPILNVQKENIFNVLWEKYGNNVKSEQLRRVFLNQKEFSAKDSNKTSIDFKGNRILYSNDNISILQRKTLDEFLKNQLQNTKSDLSKEL